MQRRKLAIVECHTSMRDFFSFYYYFIGVWSDGEKNLRFEMCVRTVYLVLYLIEGALKHQGGKDAGKLEGNGFSTDRFPVTQSPIVKIRKIGLQKVCVMSDSIFP